MVMLQFGRCLPGLSRHVESLRATASAAWLLIALIVAMLPAAATAAPVMLYADADATIQGLNYNVDGDGEPTGPITDNSNSNYGSGTTFTARFSPGTSGQHRYEKSYIRFAEDGVVFASTAHAVLEFHYARAGSPTFELFGLRDAPLVPGGYGTGRLGEDWPETGTGSITWNNAPGNDGVPTSGSGANAFDGNAVFLYEFTTNGEQYVVTNDTQAKTDALVDFLREDTNGLATFMIRAKSAGTLQARFWSKEKDGGSFAPRLEVLPAVSANYSGTGHIDIFGDPGWDSTRLPDLAADVGTIGDGAVCLVPRASKEWAGQLNVAAGGILQLNEADTTYNLTSRLQGGALEVASGSTGYFRYTGTLTLDDVAGNEIRVGNSSAQSLDFRPASTITGPGGFTKTGPGTLTLSGINTYTGTTHLEEGVLELASVAAIGPGDVALSGGVLRHTTSGEVANRIVLDITEGLAASWQFDGDALDSSGNNHHGTINGATWTEDRFGRPNQALSFDGRANNVTTTLADTFTDEFTISAWAQRTEGLSRRHARLLGFRSFGKGIDLDASGNIFVEVWVDETRTNTSPRSPLGDVLPQDEWVHLTMVVSRPESYLRFYADGALVAGRSLPAGTIDTFNNFLIGHNAPSSASDFVRHQIDDVRVYDRALSLDEIGQIGGALVVGIDIAEGAEVTYAGNIVGAGGFEKRGQGTLILTGQNTYTGPTTVAAGTLDVAHANALGPGDLAIGSGMLRHTASAEMGNRIVLDITDGLAGSWQFDGDALDSSGNNRHGTIVGATWTEDRFGQSNKALAFDGQNDYVTTTLPDVFTDEFTISAWVQRTDGASSVHQRFLGFRHFGKGVDVDASGRIFVEVNIPSASNDGRFSATRTPQESLLPLDEWVHLAMVVSRPDNWMGFYADGGLVASRSLPEGDLGAFVDFVIGKHPTYSAMGMQSSIDDVRVYDRALSAGEVGKLTNSFLAPIEITEGVEVTYMGSLVGTGGMEKLGQGTLVLAGQNTYTGPTTVAAGTLVVDGTTHANSTVTVNSGATLGGTGTIGGATIIREDATLSPGVSIGTLTFEDALILENGAIWDWEFLSNSPGEYDQVLGTNNGRLILPNDGPGTIALNIQGHDDHRLSAGDSFTLFDGDVYLGSTLLDPGQDVSDLFRITISENIDWWGTWEVTGGSLILTAVPEPGSLLLLLSALACGLLVRWRR